MGSSALDEEYYKVTGEDAKTHPKNLVKVVEAVGLTSEDRWETASVLDQLLKDRHRKPVPVSIFLESTKKYFSFLKKKKNSVLFIWIFFRCR